MKAELLHKFYVIKTGKFVKSLNTLAAYSRFALKVDRHGHQACNSWKTSDNKADLCRHVVRAQKTQNQILFRCGVYLPEAWL